MSVVIVIHANRYYVSALALSLPYILRIRGARYVTVNFTFPIDARVYLSRRAPQAKCKRKTRGFGDRGTFDIKGGFAIRVKLLDLYEHVVVNVHPLEFPALSREEIDAVVAFAARVTFYVNSEITKNVYFSTNRYFH